MLTSCIIILLITPLVLSQEVGTVESTPSSTPTLTSTQSPHILPTRSLRLPNDTYPLSYRLHISTNIHLGDWRFRGNASIDIEIRQTTNEILLHAKNLSDLQITARLLDNDRSKSVGKLVNDLTYTYDPHGTFLIIHTRQNYQAFERGQRYRLQILYTGLMGTRAVGLYWMPYEEAATNRTLYVAATQSEPTFARLIFPCYDEPGFKANFSISLTHNNSYRAVSNMPVFQLQHEGELTTTTFQTTPPMSTYLVAFVISNFGTVISETYRGITQSIYTPPTIKNQGRSALKNAVLVLAALEDYFGVSYSLPKLDHVALKKNQGAAMENWGLITYNEESILHHDSTDWYKRIKHKLVQNHEISHQWFGNLVSPEWWSYIWMNEGFATYFSYLITDSLYPTDNVMDLFIKDEADHAYSYSSFFDVHPMTYYVESESDIMKGFDIISYKRAACVIKMFHHAFNQKTFVKGVTSYLKKFQYSIVNELDLFDALQAALLEDAQFQQKSWAPMVRNIMLSWTHSEWLPVVSITRNFENNTITFRQRSLHSKNEHWWIPMNFASTQSPDFGETHAEYFMPPVLEHTLSLEELNLQLSGRDWLIVNKQQTGFYHVLYDTDNLRAIARQLQQNHTVIHVMNRRALFQDLAPLIERNEIESMEVVFELFKYLEFEEQLMPLSQVSNIIHYLTGSLFGTASQRLFNSFVRRQLTPTFNRMFRKNEAEGQVMELLTSTDILELACWVDVPECLNYTHRLALDYIFGKTNFVTDLPEYYSMHDVLLCMGVRHLSDEEFLRVIQMLLVADKNSVYFDDIIYALRCTHNHNHMQYYLNLLMGKNSTYKVLSEKESLLYLSYVFKSNIASRSLIWRFIEENYKQLSQSPQFVQLFNDITEFVPRHQRVHFATLHQNIKTYMEVQNLHPEETLIRIDSKRVGKKMRNREQFLEKFEQQIHNWLLKEVPQSETEGETVYAASLSVGNGSTRPTSLLHTANELVRSALRVNLSL